MARVGPILRYPILTFELVHVRRWSVPNVSQIEQAFDRSIVSVLLITTSTQLNESYLEGEGESGGMPEAYLSAQNEVKCKCKSTTLTNARFLFAIKTFVTDEKV